MRLQRNLFRLLVGRVYLQMHLFDALHLSHTTLNPGANMTLTTRASVCVAGFAMVVVPLWSQGPDAQIVGGPNWFTTDRFDIDAKVGFEQAKLTLEQLQPLVESLLRDRFQL